MLLPERDGTGLGVRGGAALGLLLKESRTDTSLSSPNMHLLLLNAINVFPKCIPHEDWYLTVQPVIMSFRVFAVKLGTRLSL